MVGTVGLLQTHSDVPVLMSANLESGADGVCFTHGTRIGSPMAVAATDDADLAYRHGLACGREASALGIHWAYSPVVDIDLNFRNPITNTRTFGSDPERVARLGTAYIRGIQETGVAATAKHFPGDGVDERDQHLVTTVNDLSCEEWDATYGRIYRACIDAGVMAVMVGHIALPAYSKRLRPGISDQEIMPASLAPEITTTLLREKLGFNGLVATDATVMAGMMMAADRAQAVPGAIAAGCDVFLFTRNLEEDFGYMRAGVDSGVLTPERLTDAARNVLALKAALGLHERAREELAPSAERRGDGARHGRTSDLVPGVRGQIHHPGQRGAGCPASQSRPGQARAGLRCRERHRLLRLPGATAQGFQHGREAGGAARKEGFDIEYFSVPDKPEGQMVPYAEYVAAYDLMLYVANLETKSNQTVVRIEWSPPMGANVPIFVSTVPTIFVSVANPYHLLDVPRVKTYINTYGCSDVVLDSLVERLMGRAPFEGSSPVDPFCGKWDTRL